MHADPMPDPRPSDLELEARIGALVEQRDQALSRCVFLAGRIAVLEDLVQRQSAGRLLPEAAATGVSSSGS
jgi:hypothetical protein